MTQKKGNYKQNWQEMTFKPQVPKEQYFSTSYNDITRWSSYWHQINLVLETGANNVLEVGIGNGIVCDYLKKVGLQVTTVDIDSSLNPDHTCSVTDLTKVFNENLFDVVLCAEVLEHIPFQYFEKALQALYFVSKSYVIISLPIFGLKVSFSLPIIGAKAFHLKHPFPPKHQFDGEHYWEIGKRGHPLKAVIKILEGKFVIIKHFLPPQNTYHQFFILRKKSTESNCPP